MVLAFTPRPIHHPLALTKPLGPSPSSLSKVPPPTMDHKALSWTTTDLLDPRAAGLQNRSVPGSFNDCVTVWQASLSPFPCISLVTFLYQSSFLISLVHFSLLPPLSPHVHVYSDVLECWGKHGYYFMRSWRDMSSSGWSHVCVHLFTALMLVMLLSWDIRGHLSLSCR